MRKSILLSFLLLSISFFLHAQYVGWSGTGQINLTSYGTYSDANIRPFANTTTTATIRGEVFYDNGGGRQTAAGGQQTNATLFYKANSAVLGTIDDGTWTQVAGSNFQQVGNNDALDFVINASAGTDIMYYIRFQDPGGTNVFYYLFPGTGAPHTSVPSAQSQLFKIRFNSTTTNNSKRIDGNTFDWQANEQFATDGGSANLSISWDNNNLYILCSGGFGNSDQLQFAIDVNPGTNDLSGSSKTTVFAGSDFGGFLTPDFLVRTNGTTSLDVFTRSGTSWGSAVPIYTSSLLFRSGTISEITIPRSSIGNLSTNTSFGLYAWYANSGGARYTAFGTDNATLTNTMLSSYVFTSSGIGVAPNSVTRDIGVSSSVTLTNPSYRNFYLSNGTATTSAGSATNIAGLVRIEAGTLSLGNSFNVSGNYTRNNSGGTFTHNSNTVTFNGISAQQIDVAGGTAGFHALTINNASGVNLVTSTNSLVSNTLALNAGALSLNGNTLTLNGTVTGTGTLTGSSTSDVVVGGSGALGTLNFTQTTDGTTNALRNFTMNRSSGTATLGNKLVILNGYTPTAGVLASNGNLVIRSDVNGTARIGSGSGAYITGNVNVERYIAPSVANRRAWRLLTAPVTGPTINAAWQDGVTWNGTIHSGTVTANYGTIITGMAQGDVTTANNAGFDFWPAISNAVSSIRQYTPHPTTSNWNTPVANTNSTLINAQPAYMLFVRGDRSQTTGVNSNATTLRPTGTLRTGNATTTVPAAATAAYTLSANPYASPIDFETIYNAHNTILQPRFWLWDATLNTVGGYRLVTRTTANTYTTTPYNMSTPGSQVSTTQYQFIESGAGFFVEPNGGGGTLTIQESHKASANPTTTVFRNTSTVPQVFINLNTGTGTGAQLADGVSAQFNSGNTIGIGADDIRKPVNFSETFSLMRNGTSLMTEGRPLVTANDTLFLNLANSTERTYQLQLLAANMSSAGLVAKVEDSYINQSQVVDLSGGITTYDFVVNADAASKEPARFKVVFQPAGVLPVKYTMVTASQQGSSVNIAWSVNGESNLRYYELERSANAQVFTSMAKLNARNTGTNTYNHVDAQPLTGANYYRVKSIGMAGEIAFSNVVKVVTGKASPGISVYPNPVKGEQFTLQLTNQPAGNYELRLTNQSGQLMYQQNIKHLAGSSAQTIPTGSVPKGVYQLELVAADGSRTNSKLIIQ